MMMIQVKYLPNRTFKILEISDVVFLIFYIYLNFPHICCKEEKRQRARASKRIKESSEKVKKAKKNEWQNGKKATKTKIE